MSQTIVVIPCYNEERRFAAAKYQEFAERAHDVRFLLIDDGSTDDTATLLHDLEHGDPDKFVVIDLPRNAGKAEAVRQGFVAAFRLDADYVAFWDADLATPLEAISLFRDILDDRPTLSMIIGSRLPLLGHQIVRDPMRHLLSRTFARTASWILGLRIWDTQCGAKMFRVSPQVRMLFHDPFRTSWLFDVEVFARLIQLHGSRGMTALKQEIYELPLNVWVEKGASRLGPAGFAKALREALVIVWYYRIRHRWHPVDNS
jgi:dolichyl-phosphate beta-glucosyltransferase